MNAESRQRPRSNLAARLDRNPDRPAGEEDLLKIGFLDPAAAARDLASLGAGPRAARWRERAGELEAGLVAAPDPDLALGLLQRLDRIPAPPLHPADVADLDRLLRLLSASPFLGELLLARPERMVRLLEENDLARSADEVTAALELPAGPASGSPVLWLAALNDLKRDVLLRIGARAVFGLSSLEEEFTALSRLADTLLETIVTSLWPAELPAPIVIAVGKLGGCELNFSSDLDLILALPISGDQPAEQLLPRATRIVEKGVEYLTAYTPSGSLYRLDLRLRPGGDRAPLIPSAGRLLAYYAEQGAPWERQMLVKARPCAGDIDAGRRLLHELEPFIYPAHAEHDPREEAHRLRRERRAREEGGSDHRHVKLAPGGIRDVEFVVQVLQLLYGGRLSDVRRTGTGPALDALVRARCLPEAEADILDSAYRFARRLEHLIQMQEDRQEFTLPRDPARLRAVARLAGAADADDLLGSWDRHRDRVQAVLRTLLPGLGEEESGQPVESLLTLPPGGQEAVARLSRRGFRLPARSHRVILATASGIRAGGPGAGAAFIGLLPPLLEDARATGDPDRSLNNLERILRRLGSPGAYARLLAREPSVRQALLALCASGDYLPDLLIRHPGHFERLFSRGAATAAASPAARGRRLRQARRRARTSRDLAAELESIRSREFLAAGLAYVIGERDLDTLMSGLASLARALVRTFIGHHFGEAVHPPRFCTFSLGTLSAGFMTFASDADLLFVHAEGAGARVQTLAAQVAGLLSPPGGPYRVDMRLRPEGRSAPTSVDVAYLNEYLHDRAEAWEALALSRVRPLYGRRRRLDPAATAIENWLGTFRLTPATAGELALVRRRQEAELETDPDHLFDVKRSPGALADIEYVGLALALDAGLPAAARPAHLPDLMPPLVAAGRLSEDEGRLLASLYTELRRLQIGLQLHYGRDTTWLPRSWPEGIVPTPLRGIDPGAILSQAADVRRIWGKVYGVSL